MTHCVPVYEGLSLQHASARIDLGGRDVTEYLALLLRGAGNTFNSSAEMELVKKLKEKKAWLSKTPIPLT